MAAWQTFFDKIYELKQITKPVKAEDVCTNDCIGAANDFDHDKVKADADAYELGGRLRQTIDVEERQGAPLRPGRAGLIATDNRCGRPSASRRPSRPTSTMGRASMADKVKVLVVGLGNMGASHASAYHRNPGFEIVGLMSRSIKSKRDPGRTARAIRCSRISTRRCEVTKPDAVSINSWPNTHAEYAHQGDQCRRPCVHGKAARHQHRGRRSGGGAGAGEEQRKLVLGYILRVHPSLDEVHRTRRGRWASRW